MVYLYLSLYKTGYLVLLYENYFYGELLVFNSNIM
jgi:hypothetical protein